MSNFEEVRSDIFKQFSGSDRKVLEAAATLIEASQADLEDAMEEVGDENVALRLRVLEAMVGHAWKLIMGYAGFSVALGQKVEMIDADGDPTEKMPEGMPDALAKLNESLAEFKDAYEDFIDEEEV